MIPIENEALSGKNEEISRDEPIFTIGMAAKLLGVHQRTLRIYEENGLLRPHRKGSWRYYSMRDIKWIGCLRTMIHSHGISLNAVKKLLAYTPCWNIIDCPFEKRQRCSAFFSNSMVPQRLERIKGGKKRKKQNHIAA